METLKSFKNRLSTHITGAVTRIMENQRTTNVSETHNAKMINPFTVKSVDVGMSPRSRVSRQEGLRPIILVDKIKDAAGGLVDRAIIHRNHPNRDVRASITPYIGIRARMSQIWINYYTVFLVLVIIKLVIFRMSLGNSIETAEKYTMSSCKSAENIGSSAASVPHYMAMGSNTLIATGLEHTRSGLIQMLMLSLTILEQILMMVIEMMVGTYVCLLTVAVDTAANTAINATETVISFVNSSLTNVVDGVEKGVNALQTAINSVGSAFNKIASVFTDGDDNSLISNVTLSVDSLRNLSIPTSINDKLEKLRSSVLNYDEVKNATEEVISIPFDLLKQTMNETLLQKKITFNVSAIEIPAAQQLSFCSQNSGIADFYDQIQQGVDTLAKIFIIILAAIAVGVCIPTAYNEFKQWDWLKECAENAHEVNSTLNENQVEDREMQNPVSNENIDYIEVIQAASHKWITRFQIFAARQFSDLTKKTLAKWWVEYVLYPPAVMVMLLGLGGFLVVIVQFIIFNQVKDALPGFEQGINSATEATLVDVQDGISRWANTTNVQIQNAQTDINDEVLGWLNTATGSINNTLTVFSTKMNTQLKSTFGSTPFYDGISGIVYCVIGRKIESVQKGIVWLHDHSQISLPNITSDYVLPSALYDDPSYNASATDSSKVQSLTESAVSMMVSAMRNLIEVYERSLYLELRISAILFSVWLFVALIGFIYCWYTYRRVSITPIPARTLAESKQKHSFDSDSWFFDEKDVMPAVPAPLAHRRPPPPPPPSAPPMPQPPQSASSTALSVDKEWQRYRSNNQSGVEFRPPSILVRDNSAGSPGTALNSPVYREGTPGYKVETLLPSTPVRETREQRAVFQSSPERQSMHPTRGFVHS